MNAPAKQNISSSEGTVSTSKWITPEEIMNQNLKRLRNKKKALQLQERIKRPQRKCKTPVKGDNVVQKRKNPFAKSDESTVKKVRTNFMPADEITSTDTVFEFIQASDNKPIVTDEEKQEKEKVSQDYYNIFTEEDRPEDSEIEEEKGCEVLPMDWSLKTRMRILTETPLIGPALKTSQEASGVTSFVRCIASNENLQTPLDISPGARFHQATYYWQHPHLPWMDLFPPTLKSNTGDPLSPKQQALLATEWSESLRSLYQLVRARQCPYFYVCSVSFTAMFRAAGIGGQDETHVYMTPTTRGWREALQKEKIEFKMPLKPIKKRTSLNSSKDKSIEGNLSQRPSLNVSGEKSSECANSNEEDLLKTKSEAADDNDDDEGDDWDDDLNAEEWMARMGFEEGVIRKMNSVQSRKIQSKECHDDFSAQSLLLIDDNWNCQAFINFLLNCKTLTLHVGKMAGVPPTLLAPVAFNGAVMRSLQVQQTKLQVDLVDYHSVVLKGPIMPHVMRYLFELTKESRETFSATAATYKNSEALNRANIMVMKESDKSSNGDPVFVQENLSCCGVPKETIVSMCQVGSSVNIQTLETIRFKRTLGYMWT